MYFCQIFHVMILSFLRKKPQYTVFGPEGGLSVRLTLPEGFDPAAGKCPLVLLMHGFMASKRLYPIPDLAQALAREGIASLALDFDGHGRSEGRFVEMTVPKEIEDARAALAYARSLPYVSRIAFAGHSQGGVVAGMLAGQLEDSPERPACLVQMAPAAVLKDDALAGRCMNARYDASDPPESVNVLFHRLGRGFILSAQQLPIYETSCRYSGKVCLIHGKKDRIVPFSYSEEYHRLYPDSVLHLLENEAHFLNRDKKAVVATAVGFLKENLL